MIAQRWRSWRFGSLDLGARLGSAFLDGVANVTDGSIELREVNELRAILAGPRVEQTISDERGNAFGDGLPRFAFQPGNFRDRQP
ncbi:hypothetical protein MTX20_14530 [Bradyrhizobium sp. ISRA435]|nr:hypothetical protein MTX20_14530 [Bradyrhizobium sp. ISRA435]